LLTQQLAGRQCSSSLLGVSPLLDARFGGYGALATAKAAVHRGNSGNDQFGEAIVGKVIAEISALPPRRSASTE
jgi:hypothetical protein